MEELVMKPKSDIVFKRIFGDERNKKILSSFLSAVLQINKDDLDELHILNNELLPDYQNEKQSILDLKIRLKTKELINVEIQVLPYNGMVERIYFYLSKMYYSQAVKGTDYISLKKCINITILDYNLIENDRIHNVYIFKNRDTFQELKNKLEIHILELRKLESIQDDLLNLWLHFIRASSKEVLDVISLKDEDIKKAYEVLDELNKDPKLKSIYEAREKQVNDEISWYNEAKRDGIEIGREIGKEEGLIDGEHGEKKRIAVNLLKKDLDIKLVSEVTGLSVEELINLKNSI